MTNYMLSTEEISASTKGKECVCVYHVSQPSYIELQQMPFLIQNNNNNKKTVFHGTKGFSLVKLVLGANL